MHARIRSILVYLFLLFLILTSGSVAAAGSLSGTVSDHATGAPLPGVLVALFRSDDPNSAGPSALIHVSTVAADANGDYTFTNVEARQYRIHTEPTTTNSGQHFLQADLFNVQVFDGAETTDMDLQLHEAGYIWGYVRTENGDPIPYTRVIVHGQWMEDGIDWHSTSTDQNGRYQIWVLPSPGEFYAVSTEGGVIGMTQYAAAYAPSLYQATIQGAHGPDFVLHEGGCIEGRVVNDMGVGIPNVEIDSRIGILDEPHTWTSDATDPAYDGFYSLINLPLTNQAYAYIDQWDLTPVVLDGVKYASGTRFVGPLSVNSGTNCTHATDMVMLRSGGIEGVVTDTAGIPIVGAEVQIVGFDADGNEVDDDEIYSDALGQYTFDFVPPGEYVINVTKAGWIMASKHGVIVVSDELTDIDLVMRSAAQGAVVSGKVIDYTNLDCSKDSMGTLIPNYVDNEDYILNEAVCYSGIAAFPSDFVYRGQEPITALGYVKIDDGYTDYFQPQPAETVGNFKLALPPGSTEAVLVTEFQSERGWYVLLHDRKHWNLAEGETLTNQDFRLLPLTDTGVLEGEINYPNGTSFNPQKTIIFAFNEETSLNYTFGDAFAQLHFFPAYRIGHLPAGRYTLKVFSDGFVDQTIEGVVVTSAATQVQNITLEPGATLNGSVTDTTTGLPVSGARMEVTENGKTAISESAGTYVVRGLAAGDYNLTVTKPGYASFSGAVTVNLPTTSYDIALDPQAGTISGQVVDANAAAVNDAQVVAYNPNLDIHKRSNTVAGNFAVADLPAGEYVLGIHAMGYTTVQYPATGTLTLNPNQTLTISNPIILSPTPPLFDSRSTVSESAGVKTLQITFTTDTPLLSTPTILPRGQDTATGCSSFNWQTITADKYQASCEVAPGESLVWIDIAEGGPPVIAGNPASASFSFEVATNLLSTSSTNFFNAIGGDTTIMGTQDNTQVYVPPFALVGSNTQAVTLTVQRYGNPGDAASGTNDQTVSAVYDFSFEDEQVHIDTNHVVTITLQFEKPAQMSETEFETNLRIGFFRVSDQQWVYQTDPNSGIGNIHINWLNSTVTFDASHFTRFAAFVPGADTIPGDYDSDGDVDRNDLDILLLDRNKAVEASSCGVDCDLDSDGVITVLDARKLFLLCTRSRCATE